MCIHIEKQEINVFPFALCGMPKKYYTTDASLVPHEYSFDLDFFYTLFENDYNMNSVA